MMAFSMFRCLLILATLATTWTRASLQLVEGSSAVDRKDEQPNYPRTGESKSDVDDRYRQIVKRYLESRADEFIAKHAAIGRKSRSLGRVNEDPKAGGRPFSERRLEKMLEKAIMKIITGDLSTADMLLLKSLNYSLDEVLAIRERELGKKIVESEAKKSSTDSNVVEASTKSSRSNGPEAKDDGVSSSKLENGASSSASKRSHEEQTENPVEEPLDYDAYNRQAVYDYENALNNVSQQSELDPVSSSVGGGTGSVANGDTEDEADDDLQKNFDRAMERHVVFKIRYDDSEFDSRSDERSKQLSRERAANEPKRPRYEFTIPQNSRDRSVKSARSRVTPASVNGVPTNPRNDTFQESTTHLRYSTPIVHRLAIYASTTEKTIEQGSRDAADEKFNQPRNDSSENGSDYRVETDSSLINYFPEDAKRNNLYEGLEWVEDDVYRVVSDSVDSLDYDGSANDSESETSADGIGTPGIYSDPTIGDDDEGNDTINYQNENPDDIAQAVPTNSSATHQQRANNLSAYQQLALAHRRDSNLSSAFGSQGQKAIEDIKLKVLTMTGRFNLSSSSNQVQRERLAMYSTICQAPRNTDSEAWSDSLSMNMHFQLNLTSGDHVIAAKLRIYKLPQSNATLSNNAAVDEVEEDEKKIRISVYFYTKSLKKHRSKKRLMDSVVTALTTEGSHLALDVRQAIRFWRQNTRNSHGNSSNHGLVIQLEDQDGRPLVPSEYIEQDSCHNTERPEDDKAYQRVPALFVQACSRYVRVVNGDTVTYVNCSESSRNVRH